MTRVSVGASAEPVTMALEALVGRVATMLLEGQVVSAASVDKEVSVVLELLASLRVVPGDSGTLRMEVDRSPLFSTMAKA